jgi:drug/metabolite transporter (DMT)-like permease
VNLGALCYAFAAISWGANLPLTALLFSAFDPFFMTAIRVALAVGVLWLISQARRDPAAPPLGLGFRRHALMSGSAAAFFVLYNLGLKYTHPITAAAIIAGSPVVAAATMRVVTGARLEPGFAGAAVLTLLGAGIAIWGRASASGQGLHLEGGEPLLVLALVSWTLYSIYAQRFFSPGVSQLRRTLAGLSGALPWMFGCWLLIWLSGLTGPPLLTVTPQALLWLGVTALFSTALSGVAWNIGVARAGLQLGLLWQNTVPAFGVLIAMLFGIMPTAEQLLGGAIVMAGVFYMQWRKRRAQA